MESSFKEEFANKNNIQTYIQKYSSSMLAGGMMHRIMNGNETSEAWLFRDDIGAPHGIKGYEEQVNSVGMHHGHSYWPSDITWNTWNSAT